MAIIYENNGVILPEKPGHWWRLPTEAERKLCDLTLHVEEITENDIRWMQANYPKGNGVLWWGPIPEPELETDE